MAALPESGARVRLFIAGIAPRVIDCTIGQEVGDGKVTILQKGRSEAHWETISWGQVYSLHRLNETWQKVEEPVLPLEDA